MLLADHWRVRFIYKYLDPLIDSFRLMLWSRIVGLPERQYLSGLELAVRPEHTVSQLWGVGRKEGSNTPYFRSQGRCWVFPLQKWTSKVPETENGLDVRINTCLTSAEWSPFKTPICSGNYSKNWRNISICAGRIEMALGSWLQRKCGFRTLSIKSLQTFIGHKGFQIIRPRAIIDQSHLKVQSKS